MTTTNTEYEPCIVTFIDVLGFRSMIEERPAEEIAKVLSKMAEFAAPDSPDFKFKGANARTTSETHGFIMSDAVVRVRPYDTEYKDGSLFQELYSLLLAQIELVGQGVFVRAGMTVGMAHIGPQGEGPVFGPAVVRAYELESKFAKHPRVIVDQIVLDAFKSDARLRSDNHDLEEEWGYIKPMIRRQNGDVFIDYLNPHHVGSFDDGYIGYFGFLAKHATRVKKNIAKHKSDPNVLAKYEWLAQYHNQTINKLREAHDPSHTPIANFWKYEFGTDALDYFADCIIPLS